MPRRNKPDPDDEQLKQAIETVTKADEPWRISGEMLDAAERQLAKEREAMGEVGFLEFFGDEFTEGEAWYRANLEPDEPLIVMMDRYFQLVAMGVLPDLRAKPGRRRRKK